MDEGRPRRGPYALRGIIKEAEPVRATGIVRRIDELGRVVIPKEIRRTLRIREGDPLQTTGNAWERLCTGLLALFERCMEQESSTVRKRLQESPSF